MDDPNYLEIQCEILLYQLAIFQNFYQMNREAALDLPCWEWESLLEQREVILARCEINQVMATNAGFAGDNKYISNLQKLANPVKVKPRKKMLPKNATFEEIFGGL